MDNIDITLNDTSSCFFRLPQAILEQYESMDMFLGLLPVSTGYRVGKNKHIGFNVTRHFTHDYLIHYVVKGEGFFETDKKSTTLGPGDLVLCHKDHQHTYRTTLTNPWEVYWSYFRCSYIETLFPKLDDNSFMIIHCGLDSKLLQLFQELLEKKSFGYALPYYFYATQILGLIIAQLQLLHSNPFEKSNSNSDPLISYIHGHLHEPLDISFLARRYGLSKDHFIKIFDQTYGFTPLDYFIRMRLQKACDLLMSTDYSIKYISHSIGYDDPYYFSRLFKKKIGLSPRQYRACK